MVHLLHPQEIEVFYIIPSLRKHLAIEMKKNGMKQKDIAGLLSIEDAAVSQYLSEKRGSKIKFENNMLKEIGNSAKLIKDRLSYLREMQHLLRKVRETRAICSIHMQLSNVPKECCPELINCFGDGNYGDGIIYNRQKQV